MMRYFYWDPSPVMIPISIPVIHRPLLWYGFFFALGFFLGYLILVYVIKRYLLTTPFTSPCEIERPAALVSFLYSDQTGKKEELRKALWKTMDGKTKSHFSQEMLIKPKTAQILSCCINKIIEDYPIEEERTLPIKTAYLKKFWLCLPTEAQKMEARARLFIERLLSPSLISIKKRTKDLAEHMTLVVVLGTVVGARLGDVLFYQDWKNLRIDPWSIFKVWEGGLASHGGVLGIMIALAILSYRLRTKMKGMTFLRLLDLCVIPACVVAGFIRIGNFFNQEILGKPTDVPWAVIFGHPADGSPPVARHPVQLYESLFYFSMFFFFFVLWKKFFTLRRQGRFIGLFLTFVFAFRFVIEHWKTEQSTWLSQGSYLTMGQYLSVPFILLGVVLFFYRRKG